jgi:glucosamine-6-phosphate deaminase
MNIHIDSNKKESGAAAAAKAAEILQKTIAEKGRAVFIAATGASQFEFLSALVSVNNVDWSKTVMFHLDEYVGIPETHPASFRKYLKERLIGKVHPGKVFLIDGCAKDPEAIRRDMNQTISKYSVDVAFVGIGENGHLAFNDPPADFNTEDPYLLVRLDKKCREQQMGEGWFKTLEEVPQTALSMSVRQIMKSSRIICVVPDERKAVAVQQCLEKEISPKYPASILRKHPDVDVYLDKDSSKLLKSRKTA